MGNRKLGSMVYEFGLAHRTMDSVVGRKCVSVVRLGWMDKRVLEHECGVDELARVFVRNYGYDCGYYDCVRECEDYY